MSADSNSDPVKWQVAFFALVPLALGCMTQPVGRVFDTPVERRFWIRANPFVCAGDILHFALRIPIYYIMEPRWSWCHFWAVVGDRFRDTDWSAPPPGSEQAPLGRWTIIVLGGIPCQTIKLLAMEGIPATKSLALMYAAALLFGEALNIAAEAKFRHSGPGSDPPSLPQLSPKRQKQLSASACFLTDQLQVLPVWWLTANLFAAETTIANLFAAEKTTTDGLQAMLWGAWPVLRPGGFSINCLLLIETLMFGALAFADHDNDGRLIISLEDLFDPVFLMLLPVDPGFRRGDFTLSYMVILAPWIMLLFGVMALTFVLMPPHASLFRSLGMATAETALAVLLPPLAWRLGWVVFRYLGRSKLGRILGVHHSSSEPLPDIISFYVLLLLTALSYAYVFDSTGTVNPSWLGIFG